MVAPIASSFSSTTPAHPTAIFSDVQGSTTTVSRLCHRGCIPQAFARGLRRTSGGLLAVFVDGRCAVRAHVEPRAIVLPRPSDSGTSRDGEPRLYLLGQQRIVHTV